MIRNAHLSRWIATLVLSILAGTVFGTVVYLIVISW